MGCFDIKVETCSNAERHAFMEELKRSEDLHGSSYNLVELRPGEFQLLLKQTAPWTGGILCVYMDLYDFAILYKEPIEEPIEESNETVPIQFGVYKDLLGELWIDGSWQKSYGKYKAE
jgi:hypothetical protein